MSVNSLLNTGRFSGGDDVAGNFVPGDAVEGIHGAAPVVVDALLGCYRLAMSPRYALGIDGRFY